MNVIKSHSGVLGVFTLLLTALFVAMLWITGATGAFLTEVGERLKITNAESEESSSAIQEDQPELPEYLADAYTFSLAHGETRGVIFSTIERLRQESSDTSKVAKPNSRTLFQYNPDAMSTDDFLRAIGEVSQLSSEELALLEGHRAAIDALHIGVKRDQVNLIRIVPRPSRDPRFFAKAFATLDRETFLLMSLLDFYDSPELKRKGSVFSDDFPSRLAEASAQLDRSRVLWQRAIDELGSLFRERGLTLDQPSNLSP